MPPEVCGERFVPAERHREAQHHEGDGRDHAHDEDDGPMRFRMRKRLDGRGRVEPRRPGTFVFTHPPIVGARRDFAVALARARLSV
ncbi:hypothetical protein GCM10025760_18960 [Microbacterium yannicii]|uniref:Uncharacterized protein n=1 Tax=Microbacterium yannicii TaxID=671622 RepID=A0ABP9M5W3_9MICO